MVVRASNVGQTAGSRDFESLEGKREGLAVEIQVVEQLPGFAGPRSGKSSKLPDAQGERDIGDGQADLLRGGSGGEPNSAYKGGSPYRSLAWAKRSRDVRRPRLLLGPVPKKKLAGAAFANGVADWPLPAVRPPWPLGAADSAGQPFVDEGDKVIGPGRSKSRKLYSSNFVYPVTDQIAIHFSLNPTNGELFREEFSGPIRWPKLWVAINVTDIRTFTRMCIVDTELVDGKVFVRLSGDRDFLSRYFAPELINQFEQTRGVCGDIIFTGSYSLWGKDERPVVQRDTRLVNPSLIPFLAAIGLAAEKVCAFLGDGRGYVLKDQFELESFVKGSDISRYIFPY
jgi:hypothetical protein